jgi:hypothetical protein
MAAILEMAVAAWRRKLMKGENIIGVSEERQ